MQQVDKDSNGVPDFLESSSQPSVIQADQPRTPLLLVAGVVIVLLLLVVAGLLVYVYQH
jgi:hypothetical protein